MIEIEMEFDSELFSRFISASFQNLCKKLKKMVKSKLDNQQPFSTEFIQGIVSILSSVSKD
jgi:hypothetical protein